MSFTDVTITDVLIGADGNPIAGVAVNATLSETIHNGESTVPAFTQEDVETKAEEERTPEEKEEREEKEEAPELEQIDVPVVTTAYTDAKGIFTLTLPANTDEGTNPTGSHYTITSPDASLSTKVVVAPSTLPVRLSQLATVPPVVGVAAFVDPSTGEAKEVIEALIAAGLMAPE